MHILPPAMILPLRPFAPLFSKRVLMHVQILLMGAIFAPAQRTVSAALRIMGLGQSPHFQRYHRVLNGASWSALAASRVLLRLLVAVFVPDGPLVVGIDETVERRTGAKIAAKGVCLPRHGALLAQPLRQSDGTELDLPDVAPPIPWAKRVWALPFLTALAPSERTNAAAGKRHKALTDWAWQLLLVVRRWWPERTIIAVADSGYAAIHLLARCSALPMPITVVTRLRLDAALYEPAPPSPPDRSDAPGRRESGYRRSRQGRPTPPPIGRR